CRRDGGRTREVARPPVIPQRDFVDSASRPVGVSPFSGSMTRTTLLSLAAAILVGATTAAAHAAGFELLTVGKVARFVNRGDAMDNVGIVVVGRDRALSAV